MGTRSRTFDLPGSSGPVADKSYAVKMTDKEKKHFEQLIRNAKSLAEIAKLEKDFNEGKLPELGAGGDRMEE